MPIILADAKVDVLSHKHAVEFHGENIVHCMDLKIGFTCNEELLSMLLERGPAENAPDLSSFHMREASGYPKARAGWGGMKFKAGWRNADLVMTLSGNEVGRAIGVKVWKFAAKPADGGLFDAECLLRVVHWTDFMFANAARCVGAEGVKMTISSLEQATLELTAAVGDEDGDGDDGDAGQQADLALATAGDNEAPDTSANMEQTLREQAAQFAARKRSRKKQDAADTTH